MGLPDAISGNNSYYLWGSQGATGECVIAFGYKEDLLKACFQDVRVVAEAPNPWRNASRTGRPIFLCRRPVARLDALWPRFKAYY
ncbi:MAG: hypothetical protein HZB26_19910 [Candidatus Hydrogenedentes bacterium]|nr:hypothetical protein [Candidatus Hydrogenedentota bacterium]